MPLYPKAVVRLLPLDKGMDPAIKARVVILHVRDGVGPTLFDYFKSGSGGVESHFYIRFDGTVEQYRDTDWQADANVMANGFAVSIETEGLADGTWTPAQLASIEALLAWLHVAESIPLVVPKTWDGTGVGYHVLFEAQWDQRHASCPGPNRIKQFNTVLVPWMAAGGQEPDMPLTEDDARLVLTGAAVLKNTLAPNPDTAPRVAASYLIEQTAAKVAQIAAKSSPSAPTLTDADINAIAAKTADLLAARLKS